ncbi:hypothetical protein [Marinimicrococcus flavescens]|uniref:VanZ family protein n=1 Tax=Marinimicrococcus flavescens TaxID=3031815 RepID=A0AAP3XQ51_9PROT|nr:hypothetical protein [Marinimicrococcus flavescens]
MTGGLPRWLAPARRMAALWIVTAALLALATVHLYRDVEPYRPLGGERLESGSFAAPGPLKAWQVEAGGERVQVEDGVLRLEAGPEDSFATVRQSVKLRPGEVAYRLAVEARLEGVEAGSRPWERARIYVIGASPDGKLAWDRHEDLLRSAGTTPWTRLAGDFRLAPGASEAVVLLRLHKAPGRLLVREVSLLGLEYRPLFHAASYGLMLAWVLVGGWGGALVWRHARHRWAAALLGVTVAGGFYLLLVPHPTRAAVLAWAAGLGGNLVPREMIAMAGHFLIFALIAALARLAMPQVPALVKLAVLILVAGAGEVLQFLAVDRSPSLHDWGVNASGALTGFALGSLGLALARGLRTLARRRHARSTGG